VFVGQLIRVSNTKRPDLYTYGWPPLQPIATASAYVSRSRWTLYRAVARGELPVAGRRGRALVFRREDLDRWMLGGTSEPAGLGSLERDRSGR
jgi:excisionase family DNA binding protein